MGSPPPAPPARPGLLLLCAVVFGIILVLRAQARRRALRCPLDKKTCRATGKAKAALGPHQPAN